MLQVLSRGRYLVAAFTAALTLYALAVAWTWVTPAYYVYCESQEYA